LRGSPWRCTSSSQTSADSSLDWYPGLDGKTVFVNGSGFDLAASAVRDRRRLIGVVMGGHSADWRDRQTAALLDQGFADIGIRTRRIAPGDGECAAFGLIAPGGGKAPVYGTTSSASPAL
jgi:D-alanyl-D-alanine carboxypeptidase